VDKMKYVYINFSLKKLFNGDWLYYWFFLEDYYFPVPSLEFHFCLLGFKITFVQKADIRESNNEN